MESFICYEDVTPIMGEMKSFCPSCRELVRLVARRDMFKGTVTYSMVAHGHGASVCEMGGEPVAVETWDTDSRLIAC